jgi:two-component system, LytTR family, response regulator
VNPTVKTILIDDELLARQELRFMLSEFPAISIEAEADNVDDALLKIERYKPDLIFLDINMPEKNGFELLQQLADVPIVVFVTAYDQYAIKAFEENALDYILKPTRRERLAQALERVGEEIAKRNNLFHLLNRQIFLKDGSKCYFIKLKDIHLVESMGNYTRFYFDNKICSVHRTMKQVEDGLPPAIFFRANRQQIINLQHVASVKTHYKGGLTVVVKKRTVEISQRNGVEFKKMTGL